MASAVVPTSLAELGAQCDDAAWLDALKEASIGPVVRGVRFGAAGTAGKFQRNLFKADSQQGRITFLPASMRQFVVGKVSLID